MSAATSLLRSWAANRAAWSASALVCKPVTATHVLRVDGYSQLSQLPAGEHVQSSTFEVGGHTWFLKLYPNGLSDEYAGKISAYLYLASKQASNPHGVWAKFRFSILDQLGSPRLVEDENEVRIFRASGWGCHDLISRDELEKSKYLHDDGFAVQCDVTVTTVSQEVVSDDPAVPPMVSAAADAPNPKFNDDEIAI